MAKAKANGIGHNSKKAKDDKPVDVSKEVLDLAQVQLEADKAFSAAKAKHKDKTAAITGKLKELGFKRKNFNQAYAAWYLLQTASDSKEEREIRDELVIDQAQYLQCYKALNKGKTLNFLDVIDQAKEAKVRVQEKSEAGTVEEAAV